MSGLTREVCACLSVDCLFLTQKSSHVELYCHVRTHNRVKCVLQDHNGINESNI